jgi:sugar transferase EpsL
MKRLFDLTASSLGLLVLSPFLLVICLLVKIKIGSLVLFFAQQRPGLKGRPFNLHKFRTMTNKKDMNENLLPDSERLTPFGNFLRKTSLDELPELFNFLEGDRCGLPNEGRI